MHKLFTELVRIGTSGATTDGRIIKPEWLTACAKNYNPELFTAMINWEHRPLTWFGNLGKVVSLEARPGKDEGAVELFAVLAPNEHLVEQNKQGQSLFTSMEINLEFADTGQPYLSGLAVTDNPASLGTQELRFNHQDDAIKFGGSQEVDTLTFVDASGDSTNEDATDNPETFNPEEMGLLGRLLNRFSTSHKNTPQEDEPMTPEDQEKFDAMASEVKTLTATMKDLNEKFSAIVVTPPAGETDTDTDTTPEPDEKFTAIETELESTKVQLAALTEKLNTALGTPAGNTPSGGDAPDGSNPNEFV